ncbi:drug/metabolite transporter (DMT)-like permease [Actinomadura cellulosilytica]|uniref:Drug/metabolite transporter (DMT)-like permease n=1 Tax=Thermomonospora cellulosilytica TaxID=1411118 RepID=A0A7W3MUG0_9ACTN|nr:drug/metabolite transporter (DMT)-like permease [Thermomonospora cellulosilytica]
MLALGAALAYGVADFMGGAASRRVHVLRVLLVSVPAGLVCLVAASLLSGGAPTWPGLAWGAASGLAGGTGLIAFYRALAQGPMSVVAPVSALTAAVLPVALGTLRGERLDSTVLIGVVLCVIAIGLVSMEEPKPSAPAHRPASRWRKTASSGPVMAAVSGAAFGAFFILLHEAGDNSSLWPVAAARLVGLLVVLIALLALRLNRRRIAHPTPPPADSAPSAAAERDERPATSLRNEPGRSMTFLGLTGATLLLAVGSGILDGLANALYYLAAREGLLSLAAVLTSLYPAITVLLARLVYSERLRTIQRIGLAIAATGVTLVTVG